MHTKEELNIVWDLFNLLEKLSTILFDRYHDYLIDRHLDQEVILHFENHLQELLHKHSNQHENLPNQSQIIRKPPSI